MKDKNEITIPYHLVTKQTKNGTLKIKIHTPCSKSLFHELFEILTSIVYVHIRVEFMKFFHETSNLLPQSANGRWLGIHSSKTDKNFKIQAGNIKIKSTYMVYQ